MSDRHHPLTRFLAWVLALMLAFAPASVTATVKTASWEKLTAPALLPGEFKLAQQGNAAAAEAEWLAMLKWFEAAPPTDPFGKVYVNAARMGYSRSLMQQARFDDASAFLKPGGDEVAAQVAQGKRRALMSSLWQVEDLFWLAVQKGDAAQASVWLELWGKSTGAKRSSPYQLAQLAMADLRNDQAGAEDARKHIAESRLAALSCRAVWPRYDGTQIAVKRAALVSRYRICDGVGR